jgi:hypothetical protein
MWLAILNDFHEVMYMSISAYESIESFKEHGRKKMVENVEQHNIFELTIVILVC